MTRDDFQRYLDAFNNDDFDGFSSFYADDVDFNLGDRKRIVGKMNHAGPLLSLAVLDREYEAFPIEMLRLKLHHFLSAATTRQHDG